MKGVEELEGAIARLESQRATLGDDAVDASIAALQVELSALEPTPPEEERKQVTVLFADLVGFTAMSESMDPEEVREIQDAYITSVTPPIRQFGGNVEKYIGDAVLAVFGVPAAHEDDPERAVRAALSMQAAITDLNDQLEEQRGVRLALRVGVNSGLVVSRVDEDDFVVTGDTVNLAARLQSAAEPGTVLVGEETHNRVVHAFETKSLGSIQVKGKAEPVPVYQILGARLVAEKARGIAGLDSPMVGRSAQLATLQEAVGRLRSDGGCIVNIVGEAGIGKSRLMAEVRNRYAQDGLNWVEGRCLSYGGSVAYLLWLEVLRGLMGVSVELGQDELQEVLQEWVAGLCGQEFAEVYPFLGRLFSLNLGEEVETRLEALEGSQLRQHTFQAVKRVIAQTAKKEPLVIICEDLHWADPSSLALLQALLPLIEQVPLLFICVFRVRKEHGSWGVRELAAREYTGRHLDLVLEPITAAESEQLVGNLLGLRELPSKLIWRILGKAEGNPFYVEEVIRSLIDSGAIHQDVDSGAWHVSGDVEQITIPDTLQGVLTARIDRLQREAKHILQLASVIGRVFLYRVLVAIAVEERQLDERLATLQGEELIRERARLPELEYIFKHALTQEAAYNGILKKHRRLFHRQVGQALEHLFPDRQEEMLGLLAYHWERSGEVEVAVDYLHRAGDQARFLNAHEEAVDFYQRALAILKTTGDHHQAARTLMKLGLTHHLAFDFQQAHMAYEEGFRLWGQIDQAPSLAALIPSPLALKLVNRVPKSLDTALTAEWPVAVLLSNLFSGLAALNLDLDVVPDVARSWEVSQGGRRYTIYLREDVFWSDGVPVTAGDFELAWRRLLDPATESPWGTFLYDIKGARCYHQGGGSSPHELGLHAVDDFTLVVELEEPVGHFVYLLADTPTLPIPAHVVHIHGDEWSRGDHLVTNGPFTIDSWQPRELLVLSRNPKYHGLFRGNLEKVELRDPNEFGRPMSLEWAANIFPAYEADQLDVLLTSYIPDITLVERSRQRHAGEYVSGPSLTTCYAMFDISRAPFDDLRVRQAFAHAVDRETLANVIRKGYEFPATGGLLPHGHPGYNPGIGLTYDPDHARYLLAEAGYPGGANFPPIKVNWYSGAAQHFQFLQDQWRQILGVEMISWEWAEENPPQMLIVGWGAGYPDPDYFLRVLFDSSPVVLEELYPGQGSRWRDIDYDNLVETARRTMDKDKRFALYAEAERMLIAEAPLIPLTYIRSQMLVKPWVNSYPISMLEIPFWKDVIIEDH